MTKKRKKKIT